MSRWSNSNQSTLSTTTTTTIATPRTIFTLSRFPEFVILRSLLPATVLSGITAPRALDLGFEWTLGNLSPRSGQVRSSAWLGPAQPSHARPGQGKPSWGLCCCILCYDKTATAIEFGKMPPLPRDSALVCASLPNSDQDANECVGRACGYKNRLSCLKFSRTFPG